MKKIYRKPVKKADYFYYSTVVDPIEFLRKEYK